MSGICGILRLDGGPVAGDELDPLLAALQYRGPERSGQWHEGEVAFGHALLATTPEAAAEPMPLIHQPSGCAITADVRLDNREELIEALGADSCDIGDGELVLRAYLRWGEACVDHLLGDFAFAIWDRRAQRLFAARDPIGMRQLCYAHSTGGAFVFATDPQAVVRHHLVPDTLYEPRIAQFLAGLETAEPARSFFEAVHRLEAAHCMTVRRNGQISISRYWKPEPRPLLRLKSDEAYGEALLEQLTRAIASRLRSVTPVGVMMSGGIDSTSVAAVAASILAGRGEGPLDTFSVIDSTNPDCVESRAIRDAATITGIKPHFIDAGAAAPKIDQLRRLSRELRDPFDYVMSVPRAVYAAAPERGINVVLDGVGADAVLWTEGYIAALLRDGRFLAAWREAAGEGAFWGGPWRPWRALGRSLVWAYARPAWQVREWVRDRNEDRRLLAHGQIASGFAARTGLRRSRGRLRERDRGTWAIGRDALPLQVAGPAMTAGRERYDRVAATCRIEPRDPFLDRGLIDFCLSLPTSQLQRNGFPKMVLRTAVAGLIPAAVRARRGKQHLGFRLRQAIECSAIGRDALELLRPYVPLQTDVELTGSSAGEHVSDRQHSLCALANWLSVRPRPEGDGAFIATARSHPYTTIEAADLQMPGKRVTHDQ